jgi:hypothetical protein
MVRRHGADLGLLQKTDAARWQQAAMQLLHRGEA